MSCGPPAHVLFKVSFQWASVLAQASPAWLCAKALAPQLKGKQPNSFSRRRTCFMKTYFLRRHHGARGSCWTGWWQTLSWDCRGTDQKYNVSSKHLSISGFGMSSVAQGGFGDGHGACAPVRSIVLAEGLDERVSASLRQDDWRQGWH